MFDYIHDVILNITSAEDLKDKVEVKKVKTAPGKEENVVTFKRNGQYKTNNIYDVTLTPGVPGKREILTLHCNGLIKSEKISSVDGANEVTIYETGLYQLALYVKMPNRFYGEFANANWYAFGKPIMIGFEVTEEMAKSGAVLAEKLKRLFDLAIPESNRFVSVEVKGTDLVITVREEYMHFGDIILEKYDPTVCDSCLGEYKERELVEDEVKEDSADVKHNYKITPGVESFGTAEWITENLRFPSYPRVRYKAINGDETPMQGVVYDQITFVYQSERKGFGGSDSVGQAITASTIHSFYVPHAYSAEIKTMLETKE